MFWWKKQSEHPEEPPSYRIYTSNLVHVPNVQAPPLSNFTGHDLKLLLTEQNFRDTNQNITTNLTVGAKAFKLNYGLTFGWPYVEPGAEASDPYGFFPTQDIL